MWYTLAGSLTTIFVGVIASKINSLLGKVYIPPTPKLLAPQIRRFLNNPPQPADELYIRAFEYNKVEINNNFKSLFYIFFSECIVLC